MAGRPSPFRFSTGLPPPPKAPPPLPAPPAAAPIPVIAEPPPRPTPKPRPVPAASTNRPKQQQPEPTPTPGYFRRPPGADKLTDGETSSQAYAKQPTSLMRRMAGPSDQKAGLSRDAEEVKRIIYEASKGSKYFAKQQAEDLKLTEKVEVLNRTLEELKRERGGDLSEEEALVDEMIRKLEEGRVVDECIVVVDADAFFAACHQREDPTLEGTAFAVGEGVLTTASYEARKFGCRSAMAGFVAKKLCPHLRFVKLDFEMYSKASKEIFDVLRQYGQISPASMDEAYCSLTEYCRSEGVSPEVAGQRMRVQVKAETGLTVSAGISTNTLLSKIATDINKPDGQCVVDSTREASMAFMRDLPIRKVPGIGRVNERWLQSLGVNTVNDIYEKRGALYLVRNSIALGGLLKAYLGLGSTIIEPSKRSERKGVGVEQTFRPTSDMTAIVERLGTIAESLAADLSESGFSGRTINLKLKTSDYNSFSRAKTLGSHTYMSDAATLFKRVRLDTLQPNKTDTGPHLRLGNALFAEYNREHLRNSKEPLCLRLIGLRMSNLRDERVEKPTGPLDSWNERGDATTDRFTEWDVGDGNDDPNERSSTAAATKGRAVTTPTNAVHCPVCDKVYHGSVGAMERHVAEHFEGKAATTSTKKRKSPSPPSTISKKTKKTPTTLASYFTRS